MPYKAEFIERVFFNRWDAPPSETETTEVLATLAGAGKRLGGGPLAYVCSVRSSAKLPDTGQRRNIERLMRVVLEDFAVAHMIFEGNELQLISQRLIMQAALLMTNSRNGSNLHIHGGVGPVEQDLARLYGIEVPRLLHRARELELLA